MSTNLNELQRRIAALVDQTTDLPTAGGDDWNLRLKYLNMAQREWVEVYQWPILYKEYCFLASTASSLATYDLPSDFRKLVGYPKITADGTTTDEYPVIRPQEKEQYLGTDKYCYVLGNESEGYKLIVNPPSIVSGASIFVPYQSIPTSLASPTDVSVCPNPDFLVQRAIAYLYEAREDARFPTAKAEADKILARMLEFENTYSDGSVDYRIRTNEEKRYNFRWGRN